MAKFTNIGKGARGILMKDGSTQLVEAGATVDRDEKLIVSRHADIIEGDGIPTYAAPAETGDVETLKSEVTALNAENETLKATVADQAKQIEELTKPKGAAK